MSHGEPMVSIVIPMRNERGAIEECIATFDRQDHPHDALDVIVVDGRSDDGSRELVQQLASDRPWLRLVDNPDLRASSAFNRGVEAAKGDVVCLVSAHGSVGPDFVRRSVEVLAETGAAGVGGRLEHEGTDPASRAIGRAMTSRFGMASPFRYARERRVVDTIGHPAYRREVLDEVGPFDETLERNSDYELNQRIRDAGHDLVLEPDIVTVYRPRPDLSSLARQFWDYGRWKAQIARRTPSNLRWRHAVPPALVVGTAVAPLLVGSSRGRVLVGVGAAGYAALLVAASRDGRRRADVDGPTHVAAFAVMHYSWGAGFLVGLRGDRR